MLLFKITINGIIHRLSVDQLRLTNPWHRKIESCDAITWKPQEDYGGYAKLAFGNFGLMPDLFASADWPPPPSCDIAILRTETTEEAALELLSGTAYLVSVEEDVISYEFRGTDSSVLCPDAHSFNDTLAGVVTWACGADYLDLAVDLTAARAISPDVLHTAGTKENMFDILSDMCAFYCHFFYVRGGTLYLVDMLADNGSIALTEHDFFKMSYEWQVPVAKLTADVGDTDTVVNSTFSNGEKKTVKPFHTTATVVEAALNDILTLLNSPRMDLPLPLAVSLPQPGERIDTLNRSMHIPTTAWIRGSTFKYRLEGDDEEVVISGYGGLTAV